MKILVVGGGIGGLSAGIALCQAGMKVDLVEIQPDWSIYGVGIIQPNNALRALGRIGLAQACVDQGAGYLGWQLHDAAGRVVASLPASNSAAPGCPPINGITRPALHGILLNGARTAGVNIRMATMLASWTEHARGVDVVLSDGQACTYDLIVGADGINSGLRSKLFDTELRPQFLGEGLWRYNLPKPPNMDWGGIYFGPRSKAGLVPLSATIMYMFIVAPEPDERRYEGPNLAAMMRDRLAGHEGYIAELCELIVDPAQVVYRPAYSVMIPGPWYRGRIILIGDAAHAAPPHLAQGAAMAIEDGIVIADLLGRTEEIPAVLQKFMTRRLDRTKLVVDISVQTALWETEEWAGRPDSGADPSGMLHAASESLLEDF